MLERIERLLLENGFKIGGEGELVKEKEGELEGKIKKGKGGRRG